MLRVPGNSTHREVCTADSEDRLPSREREKKYFVSLVVTLKRPTWYSQRKPNLGPSTHRADNLISKNSMDYRSVNCLFSIQFSLR